MRRVGQRWLSRGGSKRKLGQGLLVSGPGKRCESYANSDAKSDTMKAQLKIDGMSCAGCVAAVEKAINTVPGVRQATAHRPQPPVTRKENRHEPDARSRRTFPFDTETAAQAEFRLAS